MSLLQNYELHDENDELNNLFSAEGFTGVKSERKSTDKKCIFLFLFLNICFIFTCIISITDGSPERLPYGYDVRGEICGYVSKLKKR